MKKRVQIILAAVLALSLSFPLYGKAAEQGEKPPSGPGQLYAQSAVLMDADSGRILFEKNGYERRPMASTTKIVTLITVLENANPDEIVTVSDYAAGMPDVQLGIRAGERYRMEDLLYSLMLESHNDSAVAVAEHAAGSVEKFAGLMNAKARDIGCADTYFITPNGLDAQDEGGVHSTTAADLARLMRYCIMQSPKKEEFLKITRTGAYSFSDTEGLRTFTVGNKNAFLGMMEGALSGKTGFTNEAGYCYVGALRKDDRTFIVALLACGWPNNRSYKWSDTRRLMSYGLENYAYRNVWEEVPLKELPVENGIAEDGSADREASVQLRLAEEDRELQFLMAEDEKVSVELRLPQKLSAPVEEGEVVGSVVYSLGGTVVRAYPVEAAERAEKRSVRWCAEKIMGKFLRFGASLPQVVPEK